MPCWYFYLGPKIGVVPKDDALSTKFVGPSGVTDNFQRENASAPCEAQAQVQKSRPLQYLLLQSIEAT